MGCRPSRASLGRVGDSSWEYNKHFIKEQKEKKLKNKKCGRGGRRKAPVYNAFSSTSKTYTNLNSKSSRITVRLSTDGSMLEIEQYDIDLNACVNKYRADVVTASQNQVRSPHQTSIYPGLNWMQRSYSAPQLSYIAQIENVHRTRGGNNAIHVQPTGNAVVSKPKKSKSASERGFLTKSNGWCDRKHDGIKHNPTHKTSFEKTEAIVNSVNLNSCNSTFCDSDISVVDIENDHGVADTIRSAKRSKLTLNSVCENDSTSACSNHFGVYKHHNSELDNPCCSVMTGAAVNSHNIHCKGSMFEALGATDICQCSKHSVTSSTDSCPDDSQRKIHSETGSYGTDSHSRQQVFRTCENRIPCSRDKSIDNDVIQTKFLQNQRHFVLADENSNLNETVVCECNTGLPTRNINMSSAGCLDSVDSESMKRLISDIDFSRRRFVLPTQLTNGFENGDMYSSVVQSLDPQSIHSAHDSELSPNIEDTSISSRGHSVSRDIQQYEADDTTSCRKLTNLRNNLVSIETADKLMGLTEGTNYGSGTTSDFVFLMQTTSSNCRFDEIDTDIYFEDDKNVCDDSQEYYQTTGNGNVCKYVTSADDREDTTPEFEESLDESFEKRFDFSTCSRTIHTSSSPSDTRNDADDDDASSSDFDDDEFLDALESTYV